MCEEKIGKIIIPEKKNTWSEEVTYKPLSEYVGERFELFLTEKRYDRDGCIASYSSDRKLSAADLLTGQYLEKELGKSEKEVHSRLDMNKFANERIEKCMDEAVEVEDKLQVVGSLADTCNGTLSSKSRITLETYVQMEMFDRIIVKANSHFRDMTSGQYELKRKREADNKVSKSGLELNVIDYYSGSERDIKTLSGGESFKASLSMALGLSDEIQAKSGGIKIDTLFVDEGFGSLDGESLESAMRALSSITDVGRLVGIISHVSELKTRIDRQIVVTKDKEKGSKLEIIN